MGVTAFTASNSGTAVIHTVNKANPTVNWPTTLSATYGQTLANVSLPGNGAGTAGTFSWVAATTTSVGAAGTRAHSLRFTPTDQTNYNIVTNNVNITVNKANPTVTWPTNLSATYGQTLANISLPGNGTSNPAGSFTWTTPSTSVGNVGSRAFGMTFTPTDAANYNNATQNVTVTVAQATPAPVVFPASAAITYGAALSTSVLFDGAGDGSFAWTNGDIIPIVNNSGYNVTFIPNDADNYDYSGVQDWNGTAKTVIT